MSNSFVKATDCSPPGSSAVGFSRQEHWSGFPCPSPGSSRPRGRTWVSCTAGRFFALWATKEAICNRGGRTCQWFCLRTSTGERKRRSNVTVEIRGGVIFCDGRIWGKFVCVWARWETELFLGHLKYEMSITNIPCCTPDPHLGPASNNSSSLLAVHSLTLVS